MDSILVPIDFSAASKSAAHYAASYAKEANASLILFHVYLLPAPVTEVPYTMVSVNNLQADNEMLIRKEADGLRQEFGISVESEVRIGLPSEEISLYAVEKEVLMTVIGMRGQSGLDKLVGSTAASVVSKAKVPVLVVPHHSVYSPIRQIVYASDFSYMSTPNLFKPLLQIIRLFNSHLHIIHINKNSDAPNHERDALSRSTLSTLLNDGHHDFASITDESVTHGISTYLAEHQAQLLVMVAHKHNFFERLFNRMSTTEMAYETTIPLLVLHDA